MILQTVPYVLMAFVSLGTMSPEAIKRRVSQLSKNSKQKPFEHTRTALESVRLQVSRDDIEFSVYAPPVELDIHEPTKHKEDGNVIVGLHKFLWGSTDKEANCKPVYSEIPLPNEILRVHAIVSKANNRLSGIVERRRLLPDSTVGSQMLTRSVDWYRSVRAPRMAVLIIVDDCDQASLHVLVRQFMFLTYLKGTKAAVSPIYLSPPRNLGFRNGCLRTRRFLLAKQYGQSLANFLLNYPVQPIPLLEALQIGHKLTRVVYKLHSRGIAHGGICAEAFVFASGTNLKKGFRLTNFSNSFSDERGLSRVALGDLQMLFSIIGDMSPDILKTVTEPNEVPRSPELKSPKLRESLVCIHTQLWNQVLVSDVDYKRIFECLDFAIGVLSKNF